MCFGASEGGGGQLVSSETGTPPIVHTVRWAIESDQAHLPVFPVLTQLSHFLWQKRGERPSLISGGSFITGFEAIRWS